MEYPDWERQGMYAINVQEISLDQGRDSSDEKSQSANEYPELDHVPTYPWLGETYLQRKDNSKSSEPSSIRETLGRELQRDSSAQTTPSKKLASSKQSNLNPFALFRSKNYPNDEFIGPIFQISDENAT